MAVGHQEKYAQKTHTHRYLEKARHWIDRTNAPAFSIPAKKYCVHPARRLSGDADTLVLDSCRHHSESSTLTDSHALTADPAAIAPRVAGVVQTQPIIDFDCTSRIYPLAIIRLVGQ